MSKASRVSTVFFLMMLIFSAACRGFPASGSRRVHERARVFNRLARVTIRACYVVQSMGGTHSLELAETLVEKP